MSGTRVRIALPACSLFYLLQPWIIVQQQLSPRLLRIEGMDRQAMHSSLCRAPYWLATLVLAEPGEFTHYPLSWGGVKLPIVAQLGAKTQTPLDHCLDVAPGRCDTLHFASPSVARLLPRCCRSSSPVRFVHDANGPGNDLLAASSLRAARRTANVFR